MYVCTLHKWRLLLLGRVIPKYLVAELKTFADSLLYATEDSELSFVSSAPGGMRKQALVTATEYEVYWYLQREWISKSV